MNLLALLAAWLVVAWRARRRPNIVRQVKAAQAWRRELAQPRALP